MSDGRSQQPAPPVRITPWAYASLVCSLGIFCPLLTLLGPLLGIKALAEIRARPGTAGTGIAVTGIVIGLVVTVAWGGAAFWWDRNVRQPILHGPMDVLRVGLQGDVAAFRRGFFGPAAEADDQVAAAFLSELASRYGMVLNIVQDDTRDPPETEWGAVSPIVPYLMQFEGAFVSGEAEFVILDDRRSGIIAKWRWIIIRDPELGDLAYPPDAHRMRDRTLEAITGPDSDSSPDPDSDRENHTDAGDDPTD